MSAVHAQPAEAAPRGLSRGRGVFWEREAPLAWLFSVLFLSIVLLCPYAICAPAFTFLGACRLSESVCGRKTVIAGRGLMLPWLLSFPLLPVVLL